MKINKSKHRVTVDQLKEWVTYDEYTGEMHRIKGIHPKTGACYAKRKLVTGKNNHGYLWLNIFGYMYLVHRLAFLYMTGEHPTDEIDHIDGDRTNNKWSNLRQSSCFTNSRNQGIRKDCTSGVRGVTYSTRANKWIARISHMGVRHALGYFMHKSDAIEARHNAEVSYGYHPNHARRESWRG